MKNFSDWLKKKSPPTKDWKTYPILLRWHETGRMNKELKVIEKKIDYLLSRGAGSKVTEWISSDLTLTHITAERYLLDSLRAINSNIKEKFTGGGVDAYLEQSDEKIGIEVTTVNQATPEWILQERLLTYLSTHGYSRNDAIEITYDLVKIQGLKYTLDLIEKIGNQIIQGNYGIINDITIKKIADSGSYISWNNETPDNNFFTTIESSLSQILTSKSKQLGKNPQNIFFVGVNQLPVDAINPSVFRVLTNKTNPHPEWVQGLEEVVAKTLQSNVIGVCFFVYNLPSENMMYPLRILWRDKSKTIPINL